MIYRAVLAIALSAAGRNIYRGYAGAIVARARHGWLGTRGTLWRSEAIRIEEVLGARECAAIDDQAR